jgi:hypothetical protein
MEFCLSTQARALHDLVAKPLAAGLANGPIFAIVMWLI